MYAIKNSKAIRNFISQMADGAKEEEEEALLDEIEDQAAHVIDLEYSGPKEEDADENGKCFFTSNTVIDNCHGFATILRKSADVHALTKDVYQVKRYGRDHFYGVMVYTGCARGSSGSEEQYLAY